MSRTVLLTAFEPFAGADENPSMAVVAEVVRAWDRTESLVSATLPVSYRRAATELGTLLDRHAPDVVVSVGLAAGRARPGLERFALNVCDARIPDNDGDQPGDRAVLPDAPLSLATTIPVKAAWSRLADDGVDAELSTTAGTFVCNAVFFLGVAWTAAPRRAGFVHVPDAGRASVATVRAALNAGLDVEDEDRRALGATH